MRGKLRRTFERGSNPQGHYVQNFFQACLYYPLFSFEVHSRPRDWESVTACAMYTM